MDNSFGNVSYSRIYLTMKLKKAWLTATRISENPHNVLLITEICLIVPSSKSQMSSVTEEKMRSYIIYSPRQSKGVPVSHTHTHPHTSPVLDEQFFFLRNYGFKVV